MTNRSVKEVGWNYGGKSLEIINIRGFHCLADVRCGNFLSLARSVLGPLDILFVAECTAFCSREKFITRKI